MERCCVFFVACSTDRVRGRFGLEFCLWYSVRDLSEDPRLPQPLFLEDNILQGYQEKEMKCVMYLIWCLAHSEW